MFAGQIQKLLSRNESTKTYFIGCFPSDCLPRVNNFYPHCMIANIDKKGMDGSHWIALFVDSPERVEYYDSFGDWPPLSDDLTRFLSAFNTVSFNRTQFQSDMSSSCGRHAIYFLCKRCKGQTFKEIMQRFVMLKSRPDVVVNAYTRSLMNI